MKKKTQTSFSALISERLQINALIIVNIAINMIVKRRKIYKINY